MSGIAGGSHFREERGASHLNVKARMNRRVAVATAVAAFLVGVLAVALGYFLDAKEAADYYALAAVNMSASQSVADGQVSDSHSQALESLGKSVSAYVEFPQVDKGIPVVSVKDEAGLDTARGSLPDGSENRFGSAATIPEWSAGDQNMVVVGNADLFGFAPLSFVGKAFDQEGFDSLGEGRILLSDGWHPVIPLYCADLGADYGMALQTSWSGGTGLLSYVQGMFGYSGAHREDVAEQIVGLQRSLILVGVRDGLFASSSASVLVCSLGEVQ